ncbi:redox-sensitive transcriptional activator SoxR [Psychrobium sp. 1_MG-2023]|uniref:redox-sensitive transcriptional activator SoxR n=1 Tax=Psychrobium sp. 1_MG-2023 TaxID=3062624 RepID=UPI000C32E055|nr:redox-sensitive transcriptional activator SoxR [Psychrobium sp. 1_MG-2023]MDP2561136.1 redox-sensitive transcriptional activator SoxR [Psychrobium sp. 1_MG-2023]PKF55112.1 redox-sensitive transcriptional activator SoxR [Alteromonadales bacterium alter-6D02]
MSKPSTQQKIELSVGIVAKRCDVKVSTLHFYEEKGLIQSWRNNGNQRRYAPDVLRRVAVIKAAQKVGVSLQEIKQAFTTLPKNRTPTKDDWNQLSSQWHGQLTARINYLTKLRDSLTGCIGCGCLSMDKCPLYNPDDILVKEGNGAVILDRNVI